jgi:hypothetical protein
MAFLAHDLNVVAFINAAVLHLNNVMRLKWHHRLQRLQAMRGYASMSSSNHACAQAPTQTNRG